MTQTHVWTAFAMDGELNDRFIGPGATLEAAQRLCVIDQERDLATWRHFNANAAASSRPWSEPEPTINFVWVANADGNVWATPEESTFVRSYDRGYVIIESPLAT